MQEYDIRRGHHKNIEGDRLPELVREIFGKVNQMDDGFLETSFGALDMLRIKSQDKKVILVDTKMNPGVDEATAGDTIRKYNEFLQRATGFSAKERSKRIQKKAKEGAQ